MLNHRRYILTLLLIPGLLASAGARAGQRNTALEIISRSPVLERFGLAPVVPVDQPRTMQELLIMAINRNRGMRSVAARVVGALDLVPQATALPDPTLTLVEYLDPVETRVGPQQRGYQLSQSFPWFGTLGVRGDIQRAKAATARARLDEQILAVITRVRTTALELAYLDSSIAVTHNHLMLLGQWEEAAQGLELRSVKVHVLIVPAIVGLRVSLEGFDAGPDHRRSDSSRLPSGSIQSGCGSPRSSI